MINIVTIIIIMLNTVSGCRSDAETTALFVDYHDDDDDGYGVPQVEGERE